MDTKNLALKDTKTILDTCWTVAKAERVSFIVDGADYFRTLREVLLDAEREVLLIGWDFDFEIEMLPSKSDDDGNAPDGFPNQLGPFLEAVIERKPELNIYMLKWNGAVLVAPGRLGPSLALYVFANDRIHFALDGHHPFGACHHQKIVVADGHFAFCGGIDVTEGRWDTGQHLSDDPRRAGKNGKICEPWHDATSVLAGPVALDLAELARLRWYRATGKTLAVPKDLKQVTWPTGLRVDAREVDVAIARTEPPYNGEPLVNEIEELTLASIAAAQKTIYIESQYFAAETICEALKTRLGEPHGPEIILINPEAALSRLEDDAMHVLRERYLSDLRECDHSDRFRAYYPINDTREPIYVHAKIVIVDDEILKIGSSNMNDRSLGFDTECDIMIQGHENVVSEFRTRLLSEHLDVSPTTFSKTFKETGSLIETIDLLNSENGRGLRKLLQSRSGKVGEVLADTRALDPRYKPGQETSTGQGLRPRHVAAVAAIGLFLYLIWRVWDGFR
ncbi:MAG: phospholipase D-like domain-containing protein [Paracoccaceae bacterium]|nr:phospholipase D-like domain-containing protein [Paracoccaceae bacterium]